MNVTHPLAEKILARLGSRQGEAVPAGDFLDLGERSAVDQALSRLVRQGAIRRVRRPPTFKIIRAQLCGLG